MFGQEILSSNFTSFGIRCSSSCQSPTSIAAILNMLSGLHLPIPFITPGLRKPKALYQQPSYKEFLKVLIICINNPLLLLSVKVPITDVAFLCVR